jgi:Telomere resolvase
MMKSDATIGCGIKKWALEERGALFFSPGRGKVLKRVQCVWADPKRIIQALDRLRDLKSFPSPEAVNTTTGPQLPKYVSAAFGSLDTPWKPGHLRSAYGAICCHMFKPKNRTDDIFLAQILGHKLLGPNASLSVGQSYNDFYIRKP